MVSLKCRIGLLSGIMLIAVCVGNTTDENGSILLSVHALSKNIGEVDINNPDSTFWNQIPPQTIHFNRTPPLYFDGPFDDGERPTAFVKLAKNDANSVYVWMEWNDPTDNRFDQGKMYSDGGDEHIYKQHTEVTNEFGDAMCVMVPQKRGIMTQYPSMMMGNQISPVDLYLWQAGRGFSVLQAHGRASTIAGNQADSLMDQGKWIKTQDGWIVIQTIPNLISNTPICFAIWDGNKEHRDGLKYFSLWYDVKYNE